MKKLVFLVAVYFVPAVMPCYAAGNQAASPYASYKPASPGAAVPSPNTGYDGRYVGLTIESVGLQSEASTKKKHEECWVPTDKTGAAVRPSELSVKGDIVTMRGCRGRCRLTGRLGPSGSVELRDPTGQFSRRWLLQFDRQGGVVGQRDTNKCRFQSTWRKM